MEGPWKNLVCSPYKPPPREAPLAYSGKQCLPVPMTSCTGGGGTHSLSTPTPLTTYASSSATITPCKAYYQGGRYHRGEGDSRCSRPRTRDLWT